MTDVMSSHVPEPKPAGMLATAFDWYLDTIYREKAKLIPPEIRGGLEQAFMAGAQALLSEFARAHEARLPPKQIAIGIAKAQTEIDSYAVVRTALIEISRSDFGKRKP